MFGARALVKVSKEVLKTENFLNTVPSRKIERFKCISRAMFTLMHPDHLLVSAKKKKKNKLFQLSLIAIKTIGEIIIIY